MHVRAPTTLTAAAEVSLDGNPDPGVVLRLMWGPLPAPFPRALVAVGLLAALAILGFSDRSLLDWLLAIAAGLLPLGALLVQRAGEARQQARLAQVLGDTRFEPVAH